MPARKIGGGEKTQREIEQTGREKITEKVEGGGTTVRLIVREISSMENRGGREKQKKNKQTVDQG